MSRPSLKIWHFCPCSRDWLRKNLNRTCPLAMSSEVNRGNFIGIELLSLRAKDVPVVKIETPVNNFGGGGSGYGAVQNEMISIMSSKCLETIVLEIKSSD